MSFTNSIITQAAGASKSLTFRKEITSDLSIAFDQSIANGVSNQLIPIAIDVSEVQMLVLYSNVDLTIKTNSSGSPDNTINLTAGNEYVWKVGSYNTLLLTTDVTKFYVTNSSGSEALLQVMALINLP